MTQRINYCFIFVLILSLIASPLAFSQDGLGASGLLPSSAGSLSASTKEKLHALESTRFHFITLKQFHSTLFSQKRPSNNITEFEAQILNVAINKFLTSAGREMLLLEAMRLNKSVRFTFSIPEKTDDYKMIDHPTKRLAYQLEPVVKQVSSVIEIKPLFDQSKAFQISFKKGSQSVVYYVDWAGVANRSVASAG